MEPRAFGNTRVRDARRLIVAAAEFPPPFRVSLALEFAPATSEGAGPSPQSSCRNIRSAGERRQGRRITAPRRSGRLTSLRGDADMPTSTSFAVQEAMRSRGTRELAHSSETWAIPTGRAGESVCSYRPPAAERLPVDVGSDPAPAADVDGGRAAARAARKRGGDAPVADLVEADVERGSSELHDRRRRRRDGARLGVQDLGERPRELLAAAVVGVEQRVDHRHGTGQRVLHTGLRLAARTNRASST